MKKVLCLLLTTIIIISLCACSGNGETEDVRGDVVGGDNSQEVDQTEKEPEFSLGKTANNTYNNDFLGMSCTLPSEWVFYSEEEILKLNNIVEDVVDEDVAEQIKNANIIYDMYAANQTDGSNININLEKLNAVQMISLDIKQTLEAQIDTIKSTYQNMGYTDINIGYEKVKVGGKEFDGLKLTANIQGIDFYVTVFAFRKSNYLANVTFCSLQTDKTEAILNCLTIK